MNIIDIIKLILAVIAIVCIAILGTIWIADCCVKIHDDYYSDEEVEEGWR